MRWPWAGTSDNSSRDERKPSKTVETTVIGLGDWRTYLDPTVLVATAVLTGTVFAGRRLYVLYFRRIAGAAAITSDFWRKRSLFGTVTSVGDGDGFRLFLTPGGRLTGWGWLPGRRVPHGNALKENTVRAVAIPPRATPSGRFAI